jgi:outer membrane cobalamin receptor
MQWRAFLTLGAVACLTLGCAANRSATVATDPDVITNDQIARSRATNAYDLIATIRPQMFTAHGAPTTRGQQPPTPGRQALPVVVYIDNVKVGPVTELKALGTIDVKEIRYLSPRVATDRWGENHAGGVIYVTTAQGVGPDTTLSLRTQWGVLG